MTMPAAHRHRLPNRRPSHTEALEVAGQAFTATVGFDPGTCRPCEVFLTAGKEGSLMNAMLADMDTQPNGQRVRSPRFDVDERTNVIVMYGTDNQIKHAQDLIKALDVTID